jgi:predicted AlkP superfamily phosphohydrolase/phosphomutase
VFLNVQGREPQGVIPASQYETFREQLAREIEAITDEKGCRIGTEAFKPQDLYRQVKGVPPDLVVYFGKLAWRSVGTVGLRTVHTFENDTGPDDANHDKEGIFILSGPDVPPGKPWHQGQLMDIAPTLLQLFGMDVPADMQGKPLPLEQPVALV